MGHRLETYASATYFKYLGTHLQIASVSVSLDGTVVMCLTYTDTVIAWCSTDLNPVLTSAQVQFRCIRSSNRKRSD
jgi:hypothetical protein